MLKDLQTKPELDLPDWQLQELEYVGHSVQHRSLLSKLCYPGADIKHVGNVRVIFSEMFSLGEGSNETRVYLGLTKDGYGKAVKQMRRDNYLQPAQHEKKILNEFNAKMSKYVVNYYFFEGDTGTEYVYLILDLCEESLEKFVKSSALSDLQKALPDILRQILNGLADLHSGPDPILHRDLKPSNVLRDVDGKFLIADFGISRMLKNGSKTYKSKFNRGTEYWIPPES
ncbi:serine/threonine-protein kinase pakH-like [Xenia sp. Carnegie-2017]|uniref:serine/threonine-protein kinase pakH-like n=1 Tax=Xenia sp. Carnegie-2017 TaxID=2897299 RepID=UPI001F040879|nr:serine/threonine-protein kinase pakH-like [Xenia sp. Carnegie-2017]